MTVSEAEILFIYKEALLSIQDIAQKHGNDDQHDNSNDDNVDHKKTSVMTAKTYSL